MNRREFLSNTGLAAAAAVTASVSGQSRSRDERPNILVVMTDQQSADMMSITGNAHLHTPAMDELARKGVRFTKAYCTNPICVPSRTSFLTGTLSHVNGINFNRNDAPGGIRGTPLTKLVKQAGYRTGYVGKWHIPHSIDDTAWNGIDFVKYPKSNEVDFLIPDGCSEFLAGESDKPFLLFASFVNPHDICEAARILSGINDRFKNGLIPPFPDVAHCPELPPNHAIPDDEPEVIRAHQAIPTNSRTYPSANWDSENWRKYRWIYARLNELVDHHIGRVLELLKIYGVEDNTVVIFTSDHGDGNGAHQWNQKTLFYEETAGVPFMITDPRNPGNGTVNSDRLVSMGLDLFPTIFDYAGIEPPADLMGLSARPETIQTGVAHDYIVAENDLHPDYGRSGGVYGRMIRTANFKYVCYSEGAHHEQLFDLENDPGEMNNLAGSSRHQPSLEIHRRLLRDYITRTDDFFPISQAG